MADTWTPDASSSGIPGRFDKGFWATRPNIEPARGNGANAYLENNASNAKLWMWVNEVTSNFALSGTLAQSKKHRSFYPHNLAQPTVTVAGQMPNTYQYNRLAAFIREGQTVQMGDDGIDGVFYLRILGGGKDTKRPIQRGHRDPISLDGYISTIAAGVTRFINAPDFTFDFIVTKAHNYLGLVDETVTRRTLSSITDITLNQEGWVKLDDDKGGDTNPGDAGNASGGGSSPPVGTIGDPNPFD